MAIFNSYVSLPEGISADFQPYLATPEIIIPSGAVARRIAAGASGIMQLGSLDSGGKEEHTPMKCGWLGNLL